MEVQDQHDENAHFFINFLNKKVRNLNKKLKDIENLENLKDIKPEQQKKIEGRGAVEVQIKEFENIRKMYHQAESEAGKSHKQTNQKEKDHKPKNTPTLNQQEKHPVIKPTLNLVHLSQIYLNSSNKEEMQKNASNPQDLEVFLQFSQNLFGLNQASNAHSKYNLYLNHCYHELDRYLNASEEIALQNYSYKYILENVEKYVNSQYFHNIVTQKGQPEKEAPKSAVIEKKAEEKHEVVHQEVASPQKSPIKVHQPEPLVQPESPNQMITEDDKHPEEKPHHPGEEDFGEEGKFEEVVNQRGNRRGGRGGRRGRGHHGHHHKRRYDDEERHGHEPDHEHRHEHDDYYHGHGHENEHEVYDSHHDEEEKKQPDDGFITVKHKYEKKEQQNRGGRGGGGNRGRGRGYRGDRNYKSGGGEKRPQHEGDEEDSGESPQEKGAGKKGPYQRPYGRGAKRFQMEYVKKE